MAEVQNGAGATNTPSPTTTAPGAIAEAKPKVPERLTQAEEDELLKFIGKCTWGNVGLSASTRVGVGTKLTIQELCNSSIKTLQNVGSTINKAQQDHDPDFGSTDELKVSGILASKWVSALKLMIKKKRFTEWASENKSKKAELQKLIEANMSVEEKKNKYLAELAALESGASDEDE